MRGWLGVSILVLVWLMSGVAASAHSGGTDANGCHAGSRPYHCHGAPPSTRYQDSNGMIQCRDGSYTSQVGSGTCSGHGGINTGRAPSGGGLQLPSSSTQIRPLSRPDTPNALFRDFAGDPIVIAGDTVRCRDVYEIASGTPRPDEPGIDILYSRSCMTNADAPSLSGQADTAERAPSSSLDVSRARATSQPEDDDGPDAGTVVMWAIIGGCALLWWAGRS